MPFRTDTDATPKPHRCAFERSGSRKKHDPCKWGWNRSISNRALKAIGPDGPRARFPRATHSGGGLTPCSADGKPWLGPAPALSFPSGFWQQRHLRYWRRLGEAIAIQQISFLGKLVEFTASLDELCGGVKLRHTALVENHNSI